MMKKLTLLLMLSASVTSMNINAQTALDFDGVNDFADNDVYLGQEDNFTFEAMFQYRTGNELYQTIVGFGNAVEIKIANTELWYLVNNGGTGYPSPPVTLVNGTWYHVALVRNAGNWEFYLDGVSLAIPQSDVPVIPDFHNFHMGGRYGAEKLNGVLDEVRIWKVARTAQQIADYRNQCLAGNETGLFLYYMMEDGAGSTVVSDATGGGNDAILHNMDTINAWIPSVESGCSAAICAATLNNGVTLYEDTLMSVDVNANYQWYNCDAGAIVPGSTGRSFFTTTEPGNYAVIVSQSGCAADTSDCFYIDFANAGIKENNETSWISVSPNPSSGIFHIQASNSTSITIVNITGQVVYSTELSANQTTLDLGRLANGNYTLTATNTVSGQYAVERISILK